ncbi:hypothetical protein BBO_09013 [Beauveria brongniartii RCEF 3172]|uniref:Uncharacterized protein n=1 Tax=Beauveria brongniartii RCEF 3172 TaxID=1081107 RepID=A0A166WNH5_9HYPO|nr:hypothetical protein BBO_09013 [Beauveria brongniartii RCEF 3172]
MVQAPAHALHATTHLQEIRVPLGRQFPITQKFGDDSRSVGRARGELCPRQSGQDECDVVGSLVAGPDDVQHADTFCVEAKVLGERLHNGKLQISAIIKVADSECVLVCVCGTEALTR